MNIQKFVAPNTVFDTSVSFLRNVTFDSSVYLEGVTHISFQAEDAINSTTPYALLVGTIGNDVSIQYKQLGTMAFETSTNYYGKTAVDALITDLSTLANGRINDLEASVLSVNNIVYDLSTVANGRLNDVETSLGLMDTWNANQDISILALNGLIQGISLGDISTRIYDTETSILGLNNIVFDLSTVANGRINDLEASVLSVNNIVYDLSTVANGRINDLETSMGAMDTWNTRQDGSINFLFAWDKDKDASIVGLRNHLADTDASIVSLRGVNADQDASIIALRAHIADTDASFAPIIAHLVDTDASIVGIRDNIETSLGLFVLKAGDTMSGPLTISSGGLVVSNDVSITGNLVVSTNAAIGGNLTVNGSLYIVNKESIDVSSAYIVLNTGLTGVPPVTLQSGVIVQRGSLEPYVFIFDETNQTFRIGVAGETSTGYLDSSTQAVATRQDNPLANGIAFWNSTLNRFDTSTGFTINYINDRFGTIDSSIQFLWNWDIAKDASIVNLRAHLADTDASIVAIGGGWKPYVDGSLATRDSSIQYLWTWDLAKDASIIALRAHDADTDASVVSLRAHLADTDASFGPIRTHLTALDASIIRIDASLNDVIDITTIIDASFAQLYTDIADVSTRVFDLETSMGVINGIVNDLETSIGVVNGIVFDLSTLANGRINDLETSTGILNTIVFELSTNKLDAVANINVTGNASIYAYELNNVAYLKKIVAGSGATISEDTSTITIAVSGVAGYVSKYKNTFDGTANSSLGVLAVTHALGTGPLSVTVYENNQQVFPDVDVDAAGNVVIAWAPGSLTDASCKYVIMG